MTLKRDLLEALQPKGGKHSRLSSPEVKRVLDGVTRPGFESAAEIAWAILNDVDERPTCEVCGKLTRFNRLSSGYFRFCSGACASKATALRGDASPNKREDVKAKIVKTNLERYGVPSQLSRKEVHEKGVEASKLAEFDRSTGLTSPDYVKLRQERIELGTYHTQLQPTKDKIKRANTRNYQERVLPPKLDGLEELGYQLQGDFIRFGEMTWRHSCGTVFTGTPNSRFEIFCPTCRRGGSSLPHQLLLERIRADGFNPIVNDRTLIKPRGLDILFPNQRVAIEVDGVFYHDETSVGKSYHAEKTQTCAGKGVRLFHFWDYEILKNLNLVVFMVETALGKRRVVMARRCVVRSIPLEVARGFCEANHLSGYASSSTALGLFEGDELLSVLALGRQRFGVIRKALEIVRFCTKQGVQVTGGFTKLLSRVEWTGDIISYQDGRLGFGSMYSAAGFELVRKLGPNYHYVKGTARLSRQQAMKHRQPKLLGASFDPSLTEKENMRNAGWLIVYDAGHLLWKKSGTKHDPQLSQGLQEVDQQDGDSHH
jgi:very-short-patch-repair endonuclease